jgi:aminoglycoside phosphotransferase family enzyme/predicted kinase
MSSRPPRSQHYLAFLPAAFAEPGAYRETGNHLTAHRPERGQDEMQRTLIAALRDPRCYSYSASEIEVLETHISYVLLAGEFAYKIKKQVALGFLDFSTLEARRYYCEEELRLNRRTAPALYLDVVGIAGRPEHPTLGGAGPVIEYALKMRRFEQHQVLSKMMARGKLTPQLIDALTSKIAAFHSRVDVASKEAPFGDPQAIAEPALDNFRQLMSLLEQEADRATLDSLRAWTEREHEWRREVFLERKREGFVRECHGDLHLGNIALVEGEVTLYDCLEFNPALRWIDVMSEIAYLVMDLCAFHRIDLAFRLLNGYLEATGDYGGIAVLRYYLVYRALVRAKVAGIRADQPGSAQTPGDMRRYLQFAERLAGAGKPALIITHGLSGSGKTALTQSLLEKLAAIRIRSDVERKRLHGLPSQAHSGSPLAGGIYGGDTTQRTYDELKRLAHVALETGYPVIIDATFLKRRQRDVFRALAVRLGVPFVILDCRAPDEVLHRRLSAREGQERDASEANLSVLEHQLATREPLAPDETSITISIDTDSEPLEAAASRIWIGIEGRCRGWP